MGRVRRGRSDVPQRWPDGRSGHADLRVQVGDGLSLNAATQGTWTYGQIGQKEVSVDDPRRANGRAWITWLPPGWAGAGWDNGCYGASLQETPDDTDANLETADLEEALDWARARTDWVMVRPAWDIHVHYWAGVGGVPHDPGTTDDQVAMLPTPPWPPT